MCVCVSCFSHTEGHLFHIDFGHFLGNFKTKFGFNRERSAFVFTPEMAYVMGGKNYKKSSQFKLFKECCFKGFNALRKHAPILENLFTLVRRNNTHVHAAHAYTCMTRNRRIRHPDSFLSFLFPPLFRPTSFLLPAPPPFPSLSLSLLSQMCSAGMPELVDRDDILYLRDMLCLELSDRDAENRFKAEIKNSLDGTWRRLDNLIHNAVHGN